MKLTNSQEKIVNRLFNQYVLGEHPIISFKAPTGSGKTFMSSYLISRIFDFEKQQGTSKTMVVIASISDAELPRAFANKISEYKKYMPFKKFEVEHRESPSNSNNLKIESVAPFNLENNKVLVFGTSSFGKNKLFNTQGILDNFLSEAKLQKWKLIYIRDEAHKGGAKPKQTEEKEFESFDQKLTAASSFSIQMTATPNGAYPVLELSAEDLMTDNVYLLKNEAIVNPFDREITGMESVLESAINKFKSIQEEYKDLGIRPAMLIQIDSKRKDQTDEDHEKAISRILNYIEKHTSFNYLFYTSDKKENNCKADKTLEYATKSNSIYDVIIFKVGASTGWDIPRACMLVQLRDVSSETLNIQTIGRIKRNPIPGLLKNSITDKYYIYSDYQESTRSLEGYHLKDKFRTLNMYSGSLVIEKELFEEQYISSAWEYILDSDIVIQVEETQKAKVIEYTTQTFRGDVHTATIKNRISNAMRLKIWVTNFINQNQTILPDQLLRKIKKYCLDNNLKYDIFIFELRGRTSEFKSIYNGAYESSQKNDKYKIDKSNTPMSFYQIWRDNNDKNVIDVSDLSEYGYELVIDVNKAKKNLQYLDSFPEKEAIETILDYIDVDFIKQQIKFIAKMPTLGSKIYFEYFNSDDVSVHKSFIDFAIVTNDNRVLMVEIKGHDDYDPEKTKSLIKSYSKYMKIDTNKSIEIAVIFAGKKDGDVAKPFAVIWNAVNESYEKKSVRDLVDKFFRAAYIK